MCVCPGDDAPPRNDASHKDGAPRGGGAPPGWGGGKGRAATAEAVLSLAMLVAVHVLVTVVTSSMEAVVEERVKVRFRAQLLKMQSKLSGIDEGQIKMLEDDESVTALVEALRGEANVLKSSSQ